MALYRVTLSGLLFGQVCQNVLHFATGGGGSSSEQLALAVSIRDQWVPPIRPRIGDQASFTQVEVRQLLVANAPTLLPINLAGSAGSIDQTFPFAAYKIKLRTAVATRHGHGRFYQWGIGPGSMSAGIMLPSVVSDWTGTLTTLKGRYLQVGGTTGFALAVVPRANPSNFVTVTDMIISPIPGVMRRRNIGVGM